MEPESLNQACAYPNLSDSAAVDLANLARTGDRGARNKLFYHHIRLVGYIATLYAKHFKAHFDDYFQAGCEALLKCIPKFESERGVPFRTWASQQVNFYIWKEVTKERKYIERSEVLRLLATCYDGITKDEGDEEDSDEPCDASRNRAERIAGRSLADFDEEKVAAHDRMREEVRWHTIQAEAGNYDWLSGLSPTVGRDSTIESAFEIAQYNELIRLLCKVVDSGTKLTACHVQSILLRAQGHGEQEIANTLGIARYTVHTYLKQTKEVLQRATGFVPATKKQGKRRRRKRDGI